MVFAGAITNLFEHVLVVQGNKNHSRISRQRDGARIYLRVKLFLDEVEQDCVEDGV